MAFSTHEFKLDLTPGASRPVLYASQGDIGRPFMARCYWNGATWTATGNTANIRGRKPDETVFDYTATVDGSTVTFETTEQMTIVSGPVECELVFTSGGDVIASANFVLMVEESPYDPNALSESDIPTIGDLIEETIGGDIRDEVDALIEANPELMLQDNAVTTAKIASGAVTEGKIASNAVTTGKLATGAVTAAKVNADFLKTIENAYVTPEMFGAVGNGTTDDTAAIEQAIATGKTVVFDNAKRYKADIVLDRDNITLFGLNLKGTITGSTFRKFVRIINADIDATGKNYGITTTENISKFSLVNVHVHDATLDNISVMKSWDNSFVNVSASGAGRDNIVLQQFNNGYFSGTSYMCAGVGLRVSEAAACTIQLTSQENKKTGAIFDNVTGSILRLYLEQNGYEGTTNEEKSQAVIGNTSACIGNTISFYANGGLDSEMESAFGLYLKYASSNKITGYAVRHTDTGFRCTSNASKNDFDVLDTTHGTNTYDYDASVPKVIASQGATSNTLITVPTTVRVEFIAVITDDVKATVAVQKRTSTQVLVRVADNTGTNVSVNVLLLTYGSGIRTA